MIRTKNFRYHVIDMPREVRCLCGVVLICWCWSLIATRFRSIFLVAWRQARWRSDPENPSVRAAIDDMSTFFHAFFSNIMDARLLKRINSLCSIGGKSTFIIRWNRLSNPGSIVHGKFVEARKRKGCWYLTNPSNCTRNSALHLWKLY